jgi:hypothetical protein
MKSKLLLLSARLAAPFASAQITLNDFSAFASPTNTFFTGDWELTGDPAGSSSPRASFSQGAGFYNFAGGSNADTATAVYFFDAPLNITGLSLLQVSARLVAGNTAPALTITLFDSTGGSAFAVVAPSAFAGAGFTTLSSVLTFSGFNASDLSSFQLSGNVVNGSNTLNLSIDNLAVAAPRVITPVPEPAAYGALGVVALLTLTSVRRFRRTT